MTPKEELSVQKRLEEYGYTFSEKNEQGLKKVTDPNGTELGVKTLSSVLEILKSEDLKHIIK